jgi:hypothetical protein
MHGIHFSVYCNTLLKKSSFKIGPKWGYVNNLKLAILKAIGHKDCQIKITT